MCIIIGLLPLKEMTKEIERKPLEMSWKSNKDGAGFSYVVNTNTPQAKVVVTKGYTNRDKFINKLYKAREIYPDSNFLVHLRNTTVGETNKKSCHPFLISDKLSFAHNGTIHSLKKYANNGESDSMVLLDILKDIYKLDKSFIKNQSIINMLHAMLVENKVYESRLMFLSNDNELTYLNPEKWIEEQNGEITYSNDYYKKERITPYNNNCYKTTNAIKNFYSYGKEQTDWYRGVYGNGSKSEETCNYCNNILISKFEKEINCCEMCYVNKANEILDNV